MSCGSSFDKEQIELIENTIREYRKAELAIGLNGGTLSYTIDTGQTRQTVTRNDLGKIRSTINSLMNELAVLRVRVYGCGANIATPGF